MSQLERLPSHIFELFDYRTRTCLSTVNHKWNRQCCFINTMKRSSRTSEILTYLQTVDSITKTKIIFEKLSYKDVWRLFTEIQIQHGFGNMRYVYVPYTSTNDTVNTSANIILHLPCIQVMASVHLIIDSMPILFGNCLFATSRENILYQIWQAINLIWHNNIDYDNDPIVTWFANNIMMCKIDTYNMKMYVSKPYKLYDYNSSPEIDTWFTTYTQPNYIYTIVNGLLS